MDLFMITLTSPISDDCILTKYLHKFETHTTFEQHFLNAERNCLTLTVCFFISHTSFLTYSIARKRAKLERKSPMEITIVLNLFITGLVQFASNLDLDKKKHFDFKFLAAIQNISFSQIFTWVIFKGKLWFSFAAHWNKSVWISIKRYFRLNSVSY